MSEDEYIIPSSEEDFTLFKVFKVDAWQWQNAG